MDALETVLSTEKTVLSIGPWSNTSVNDALPLNACLRSVFETFPVAPFRYTLKDIELCRVLGNGFCHFRIADARSANRRAPRRSAEDNSQFYRRGDCLLHWRRDCVLDWNAFRQNFCALLAAEHRVVLRASDNATQTVVDIHPCSFSGTRRGGTASRDADGSIACCLRDQLRCRDNQCLRRAALAGRASLVRQRSQSHGLCLHHGLLKPRALRLWRRIRPDSRRGFHRELRVVLGTLVRVQRTGESDARPSSDDHA